MPGGGETGPKSPSVTPCSALLPWWDTTSTMTGPCPVADCWNAGHNRRSTRSPRLNWLRRRIGTRFHPSSSPPIPIAWLRMRCEPGGPPPSGTTQDILNNLANEADVFGSLLPSLGPILGAALAEEWRPLGNPALAAVASAKGRLGFLRAYPVLSAAAVAIGLQAARGSRRRCLHLDRRSARGWDHARGRVRVA